MRAAKVFGFLLLVVISINGSEAEGINRCKVNNSIVFQQEPCRDTGETVGQAIDRKKKEVQLQEAERTLQTEASRLKQQKLDARPISSLNAEDRADRERRETDARIREYLDPLKIEQANQDIQKEFDKYCSGKSYDRLFIGMTENEMLHCSFYRSPVAVNTTQTGNSLRKQYVFRISGVTGPTTYAYFRNGILETIQN